MVANMTKESVDKLKYRMFGPENFVVLIPSIVHMVAPKNQAKIAEPLACYIAIFALFMMYLIHMTCIAQ